MVSSVLLIPYITLKNFVLCDLVIEHTLFLAKNLELSGINFLNGVSNYFVPELYLHTQIRYLLFPDRKIVFTQLYFSLVIGAVL